MIGVFLNGIADLTSVMQAKFSGCAFPWFACLLNKQLHRTSCAWVAARHAQVNSDRLRIVIGEAAAVWHSVTTAFLRNNCWSYDPPVTISTCAFLWAQVQDWAVFGQLNEKSSVLKMKTIDLKYLVWAYQKWRPLLLNGVFEQFCWHICRFYG